MTNLTTFTSTSAVLEAFQAQPQRPLEFWLDGQLLVGPGYHVTEIKAVNVESVDCGGKVDTWSETVFQLMDGTAEEAKQGFMSNRKFMAIYDRVSQKIAVNLKAEARFEYGNEQAPALQYHVERIEITSEYLRVHLRNPGVQCKAGDACGLPAAATENESCAPNSGCCS